MVRQLPSPVQGQGGAEHDEHGLRENDGPQSDAPGKHVQQQNDGWDDGNAQANGQRQPLCAGGLEPAAAGILRNVATRFFIGQVQPWSAALGQRQHGLLPPLRELEDLLSAVLPADYRQWQRVRDAALVEWSAAPREHVGALQALLGSCFSEFAAPPETSEEPSLP